MGQPPKPHQVNADPGLVWHKDQPPALDAPPDDQPAPAPEAQWPPQARRTGVCGVVTPNVVPLADGYRMYYTQILPRPGFAAGANDYDNATTRILSATSADGTRWTPEPGVRLGPRQGGAGDFRVVSPEVVPALDRENQWRMYYECCPGPQSGPSTLRSAISTDGLNWEVEPGVRLGADDASFYSPRVVFLDGGHCRLYCGARGKGILSALSTDGGLTFALEPGARLKPGSGYDALTAFAPEVLPIAGGGYRMYYAGYSAPNRAYVLAATSADGLHWQKEARPVLEPGGPWDGAKCSEMSLLSLPDGGHRLFYEACDGSAADERGVWRIASATAAP